MDINFELYKVFYHVANTLSFSEASKHLFVSQSSVSQTIKLLEEKLGCKLFIRSTKSVRLTQEGEVLFRHLEPAYLYIKNGERKLIEMRTLEAGEIRIGASDTICKHYLLPYFQQFSTQYPKIKIHVTNRPSPVCLELLQKGEVDVIMINLPSHIDTQIFDVVLKRPIQDIFIAGRQFEHLREKVITMQELTQLPLLALEENTSTRSFLNQLASTNQVSIQPEFELSSVDLLIDLVKINFGISFLTKDYVLNELTSGEVIELQLKEKIPNRDLGIITHKHIPTPLAATKFISLLQASFIME
ncbi:LysR family transcriptional regulator [Desulfuribacillus stibiiarsenatis]|uniref:LysR family transcriptional regulator n=1 Tax=Desulfuribacillus stibiiarsenatis TaxID=1390249 RepID=A0A1E5L5V2_9FIRM|nr:LysR family transcriptional regulator [Desulfuribacillus stibiiarsenatis]